MLPRRGYEPVDDGDEDINPALHPMTGSYHSDHARGEREGSALRLSAAPVTENNAAGKKNKPKPTTSNNDKGAAASSSGVKDEDGGGMTIRVLDVRGVFYPLRGLTPETTVGELKLMLVTETGVETARQRIIHAGKVRSVFVA